MGWVCYFNGGVSRMASKIGTAVCRTARTMEKQHNRGQEGAGMACVKLGGKPGHEYMFRERAEGKNAVTEIFGKANANFKNLTPEQLADAKFAQEELPFAGGGVRGR